MMPESQTLDINVTTYYLGMGRPEPLDIPEPPEGLILRRLQHKTPEYCEFLFSRVGAPFRWFSRQGWSYQEWAAHCQEQTVEIYVASYGEAPIGYFELIYDELHISAELKFIGLMPTQHGKGYGKWLLNSAIFHAFNAYTECQRLWLHTCSEDHPAALQNYLNRGFVLENQETEWDSIPDFNSSLWLGERFTQTYLDKFIRKVK